MLPNQKATVDRYLEELIAAHEYTAPVAISYFHITAKLLSKKERDLVESKVIDADKLNLLFNIIKEKESGWLHLMNYLRLNSQCHLANKLQNDSNEETVESPAKRPKGSALGVFASRLAEYYQLNYADVPTMGESPKHVKDVWVPMKMDGRSESFLPSDRIDHTKLLSRLKADQHRNVALIKGDPGMGKTTLAKKIAYDWAANYESTDAQQFRLVLAVPLRSATKSTLFDQLAIEYFLSIGGGQLLKGINREDLIAEIKQLKSQLLVILDGLDEYASYGGSPFKEMFAAPFQHTSVGCNVPPPIIIFKLIITSRPYACESITRDFSMLRFTILPLDANHLSEFVRLYCQTSDGVAKVTEYLKTNAKLVIQVPLILTFVCYLADSVQEIPTNMTSLYDSLIKQMLIREKRQGKLKEIVDIDNWKETNVVKSTSQLGFVGCAELFKLEFPTEYLRKFNVTNDSFVCGFLLHKFVFVQDSLMAEFPHRSIQEFFAALHCYQLMLTSCKDELSDVVKLICAKDYQIGRFFFGICSKDGRFDQMTSWFNPSLHFCDGDTFNPTSALSIFGANLIDCYPKDHCTVGQMLYRSVGKLDAKMLSYRPRNKFSRFVAFEITFAENDHISNDFKEGLHFGVLPNKSGKLNWFLADNPKSARLIVVFNRQSDLLGTFFGQIEFFVWTIWPFDPSCISEVKYVPPARTLIMSVETIEVVYPQSTVVIVYVNYSNNFGSQLTQFRLDYSNGIREKFLSCITKEKFVELTVDGKIADSNDSTLRINVTVNEYICQSTLIYSLIRLSLLQCTNSSELDVVCAMISEVPE